MCQNKTFCKTPNPQTRSEQPVAKTNGGQYSPYRNDSKPFKAPFLTEPPFGQSALAPSGRYYGCRGWVCPLGISSGPFCAPCFESGRSAKKILSLSPMNRRCVETECRSVRAAEPSDRLPDKPGTIGSGLIWKSPEPMRHRRRWILPAERQALRRLPQIRLPAKPPPADRPKDPAKPVGIAPIGGKKRTCPTKLPPKA